MGHKKNNEQNTLPSINITAEQNYLNLHNDFNPINNIKDYISSRPNMIGNSILCMIEHKTLTLVKNMTESNQETTNPPKQLTASCTTLPKVFSMIYSNNCDFDAFQVSTPTKKDSEIYSAGYNPNKNPWDDDEFKSKKEKYEKARMGRLVKPK